MSFSTAQFKKLAILAARSVDAKKGIDIKILDMRRTRSGHSDYLLIASANSQVHMKTLLDTVEETLDQIGLDPLHREGNRDSRWAALDYGGLLAHIFVENVRDLYSLERLWPEAGLVEWEDAPALKAKPKRKPLLKRKK